MSADFKVGAIVILTKGPFEGSTGKIVGPYLGPWTGLSHAWRVEVERDTGLHTTMAIREAWMALHDPMRCDICGDSVEERTQMEYPVIRTSTGTRCSFWCDQCLSQHDGDDYDARP